MNVCIFLDDSGFSNKDLSKPYLGNPGVGGTQYCFAMLVESLRSYKDISIVIIHPNPTNTLPSANKIEIAAGIEDGFRVAKALRPDLFLCRFCNEKHFYDLVNETGIPVVLWSHNFCLLSGLRLASKCQLVKRVVFVGRELYDLYFDDPIIYKSVCIENMYYGNKQIHSKQRNQNVVYVGGLTRTKGFLRLAKNWKALLAAVPDAHLYVLGSGHLYNENEVMGPAGLAESTFESDFMSFLRDADGSLLKSVTFLGLVSSGKDDYYLSSRVGVVNPTGESEILPISALEMEACGLPIVSVRKNGLLDAVKNNRTGLLFRNDKNFVRDMRILLTDEAVFSKMSAECPKYVEERFSPSVISQKWSSLFFDVVDGKKTKLEIPSSNMWAHLKLLKLLNHYLRRVFPFLCPIERVKMWTKSAILKILHR